MAERKKKHAGNDVPAEQDATPVYYDKADDEHCKGQDETADTQADESSEGKPDETARLGAELKEANEKYLRLYAEMENYRKKMRKDREEFLAYCNEDLLYELLPVLDTLEMAIMHSAAGNEESQGSLKQGVENTLREFLRTLEKFGLKPIDAVGQPFDPAYHHAMSQVDRPDVEPDSVVEEMRRGYVYKEKVLRPSMVAVSKKPQEDNG
jgi:molecular chaperone GrpE